MKKWVVTISYLFGSSTKIPIKANTERKACIRAEKKFMKEHPECNFVQVIGVDEVIEKE